MNLIAYTDGHGDRLGHRDRVQTEWTPIEQFEADEKYRLNRIFGIHIETVVACKYPFYL